MWAYRLIALVVVGVALAAVSGETSALEFDPRVCDTDGVSLSGFDPITYFEASGPQLGDSMFSAQHAGATYYFVSRTNHERFLADPEHYVPRYSGYCATALAVGILVCPDATNFQIQDGHLYLFEVTAFTNARVIWNQDAVSYKLKADRRYAELRALKP